MSQDKPKIIVDSDWKAQAEKEKEQLSAKLGEDKPAEARQPAAGEADAGQELPKPDFLNHCASVATQAMIFLGAIRHPMTGQIEFDPAQARYLIDTLQILKDKTKGNLDAKESETLESMLGELKMVWVQVIQELQRRQQEQKA